MKKIIDIIKQLIKDAVSATLELCKVMIPTLILVKILQELGLIEYLAWPLKPIMGLLGLPAEMGLVWATAIINNIYTGMVVLASLVGDTPLTSAQATILGLIMLIAHALPVEIAITRKSGARFPFQIFVRMAGALALGWLLNTIYTATGTLQEPATILFQVDAAASADPALLNWALGQAKNVGSVFFIIFALLTMMRILHATGIIELMNRLLRPILNLIGIGPKASAITVIGLTMGLSYGGGLIINEAKNGNVGKQDIFYSLTLMGLSHSLIEDTLLIMLIGGHISGILWARLLFSIIAMIGIVQIVRRLPKHIQNNYLWVEQSQ